MAKLTQGKGAKEISIDTYKQIMLGVVHASAVGLSEVLKNYKSEVERTNLIRTYVNKIRFFPDQTGYFFVHDFDGLNIFHPIKKVQGKNNYDEKDSQGKYYVRELNSAAKKGGGFVEYYWPKPGEAEEHKKLSYAESISGTKYVIGTGVFF